MSSHRISRDQILEVVKEALTVLSPLEDPKFTKFISEECDQAHRLLFTGPLEPNDLYSNRELQKKNITQTIKKHLGEKFEIFAHDLGANFFEIRITLI